MRSSKFKDKKGSSQQKVGSQKIQGLNWGYQNSSRKVESTKFWDENWLTKTQG